MADVKLSALPDGASLTGTELVEITQASTSVTVTATTISATSADNSFSDSGSAFVSTGFLIGDTVTVSGFTESGNNLATGVVTAVTAGKLTIGGVDGNTIVDEAAGDTVTIARLDSAKTTASAVGALGGGGGGGGSSSAAIAELSTDITGLNANSYTAITWTGTIFDDNSFWASGNPTRLTVPSGVTRVRLAANVRLESVTNNIDAMFAIYKNGSQTWKGVATDQQTASSSVARLSCGTGIIQVTAGDYFEVRVITAGDTSITVASSRSTFSIETVA